MSERLKAIAQHIKLLTYEEMRVLGMGLSATAVNQSIKTKLPSLSFTEMLHAWSQGTLAQAPAEAPISVNEKVKE